MIVVLTGGAGFIGSHIAEALVARGDTVRVIDNLSSGRLSNLDPVKGKVRFTQGSCGDERLMMEVLEGADAVVHQAALTSVQRSMRSPLETFRETLAASVTALECARLRGVKRFIYAASSSAYGNAQAERKHEGLYPAPLSPYAASKVSLEMFAQSYSRGFGLMTVGLRYFNVFGPRQDPGSEYAAVIPRFIKLMLAGKPPVITGDGDQSRDFTFVRNVVAANLRAMEIPLEPKGLVANVATGKRVTLPELVEGLNKVSGLSLSPQFGPARPGDVRHSLADLRHAQDVLGYRPQVEFLEGLAETWKHYKEASSS